jgi:hypothetical protein
MQVKSAIEFWFGRSAANLPVQKIRRHGRNPAIAFVLSTGAGLQAHLPLDPMQAPFYASRQEVIPDRRAP